MNLIGLEGDNDLWSLASDAPLQERARIVIMTCDKRKKRDILRKQSNANAI